MLKLQPVKTAAQNQLQSDQIQKSDVEDQEALIEYRYIRAGAGGSWTYFRDGCTLSLSDQR